MYVFHHTIIFIHTCICACMCVFVSACVHTYVYVHKCLYYLSFQPSKVLRAICIIHFYSYYYILIFVLYFLGQWQLQYHTWSQLMSSLLLSNPDCGDHIICIYIFFKLTYMLKIIKLHTLSICGLMYVN